MEILSSTLVYAVGTNDQYIAMPPAKTKGNHVMRQPLRVLSMFFLLCSASLAFGQRANVCGSLDNLFGPYDYTNAAHRRYLPTVEDYHFYAEVEDLSGRNVPGDLDYTLRAFPNHHRALYAMSRFYLERVPKGANKMRYSAECYFTRARRFRPDDETVVMLEGIYFKKIGDMAAAKASFDQALSMAPNSAEVQYNVGLLYADLGDYEKALKLARGAYALGFPLPGLKNKLRKAGVWTEDAAAKE